MSPMTETVSDATRAAKRSVRILTILGWIMIVAAGLGCAMGLVISFHANAALSAADSARLQASGVMEALYNVLFVLPGLIVLFVARRLRAKLESATARARR